MRAEAHTSATPPGGASDWSTPKGRSMRAEAHTSATLGRDSGSDSGGGGALNEGRGSHLGNTNEPLFTAVPGSVRSMRAEAHTSATPSGSACGDSDTVERSMRAEAHTSATLNTPRGGVGVPLRSMRAEAHTSATLDSDFLAQPSSHRSMRAEAHTLGNTGAPRSVDVVGVVAQ